MEVPLVTKGCMLRHYIEMLGSSEYETLVIDRELDQQGGGYGERTCGKCALHLAAKNGAVSLDKPTAVSICLEVSDPDSLPNILC